MMNWYQVKTPKSGETYNEVWHRGKKIDYGFKLLLSEDLAQLHGLAVTKTSAPKEIAECAFVEDFQEKSK